MLSFILYRNILWGYLFINFAIYNYYNNISMVNKYVNFIFFSFITVIQYYWGYLVIKKVYKTVRQLDNKDE